jgi:hypothetical protein
VSTLAPLIHRRPRFGAILYPLAAVVGLIVFGLLVAAQPVAAVGLVVVGIGVAAAATRPQAVGFVAIAVLGLVPVYSAPAAGPLVTHPSVLASWMAAGGLLLLIFLGQDTFKLTVVDLAMAVFFGLFALAVLFESREKGDYITIVFTTLGPYLAMRLLMPRMDVNWLARAFAVAMLISLPFVV